MGRFSMLLAFCEAMSFVPRFDAGRVFCELRQDTFEKLILRLKGGVPRHGHGERDTVLDRTEVE